MPSKNSFMKKLKYKVPDSSAQMLTTKHADLEEQKEWKDTCIIKERDDIKKRTQISRQT